MIRWRYMGIRLLAIVAIAMLLKWSVNPVAHWIITRTLQSSVGARVEIASTDIGLFPPRVLISGLAVADPRKEMRNALEADQIVLAIDGGALLRRRYEVSRAAIRGIRLGGGRTTSGRLEIVESETESEAEAGPSLIGQWCEQLAGDAQGNAEAFAESLATVREGKAIRDQWEKEYRQLKTRTEGIEKQVKTIRDSVKGIDNPLRDLPAVQATLRQADDVRRDLTTLRQQVDSLPGQVRGDMARLDQARWEDQERVRSYLPEGFQDQGAALGPELLTSLVRDQLQQVRDYVESGRRIADVTVASPRAERGRGETIELGGPRGPDWLIRTCDVSGEMTVNGARYDMLGVIENITTDHSRRSGPLHARLRLEGPRVVRIDYQRFYDDASFGTRPPRDHLKIHWPRLPLPATRIGNRKDAALVIDGGDLELWVDLKTQGNQMSGRLVSRQQNTQISLTARPELEKTVLVQSLSQGLSNIHRIDVDAHFEGNWDQMQLEISTSLSEQLAASVRSAVDQSMVVARERMTREIDKTYREQTRQIEDWLSKQQSATRALLAEADQAVESISKKAVAELGLPDAYLGRMRGGLKGLLK